MSTLVSLVDGHRQEAGGEEEEGMKAEGGERRRVCAYELGAQEICLGTDEPQVLLLCGGGPLEMARGSVPVAATRVLRASLRVCVRVCLCVIRQLD
jgi:hypothetical protein